MISATFEICRALKAETRSGSITTSGYNEWPIIQATRRRHTFGYPEFGTILHTKFVHKRLSQEIKLRLLVKLSR